MTPEPTSGPPHAPRPGAANDREDGHPGPAVAVPDSDGPAPDIQVNGNRLFVTIDLQGLPADEVAHYLGTNLLILWRRRGPDDATQPETARLIRFPVDIEPKEAILRVTNNVLDLAAPLARRLQNPTTGSDPTKRAPEDEKQ